MSRVQIQSDGTVEGTVVLLDGKDIRDILRRVEFVLPIDGPPSIKLELLNAEVEAIGDAQLMYACLDERCPMGLRKRDG